MARVSNLLNEVITVGCSSWSQAGSERARRLLPMVVLVGILGLIGCTSSDSPAPQPGVDASDSSTDSSTDFLTPDSVAADVGSDVIDDTGTDADASTLPDTTSDGGFSDLPLTDSSEDVAGDVAEDSGEDSSVDASEPDASETDAAQIDPCGNGVVEADEACDDGGAASWCAADCSSLIDVSTVEAWTGHRSFDTLTASNGFGVATWSGGRFDRLLYHPYSAYDEANPTQDYLFDAYFGQRIGADGQWFDAIEPTTVSYVPGTGVMRIERTVGELLVTTFGIVPFHGEARRLLVLAAKVHNPTGEPVDAGSLAVLWNLHLGGDGDSAGESAAWRSAGYLAEWRGTTRAVYLPLAGAGVGSAHYAVDVGGGAQNPWMRLTSGQAFADHVTGGPADDLVAGFEAPIGVIPPGESRWTGSVAVIGEGLPEAALEAEAFDFVAGRDPEAILDAELEFWTEWHSEETPPEGLSADEAAVYRQSTTILKMAQVRETAATGCPSDRCYGQILASMVPGVWSIAWVRDAAYAIIGLLRAGHVDEARAALEFMLRAEMRPLIDGEPDSGNYYQKVHIESGDPSAGIWGLGVPLPAPYAISVARYFGSGLEESDGNAAGPNIEWDNWGLFAWAFAEYVDTTADTDFLDQWWPTVGPRVGDLLVALIDPATGLLAPDSSIWERHWCPHGACDEPETRKHHGYSSVMATYGLRRLAGLVEAKDPERHAAYLTAAEDLAAAIVAQLVVTPPATGLPALAGNLEEIPYPVYYLDLSMVEAINLGIVPAGSLEAFGTMAAFDHYLATGSQSPGYVRTDDPTWYDGQEWVVMDLRAASAFVRMGQVGRARTLVGWVVSQARHNFDLIAELLSDGIYQPGSEDERWQPGQDAGADYQGAIPMCGFGPGALIMALHDVYPTVP